MLLQQGRAALAETELRQAIGQEPQDPFARALLALCLSEQEKFEEASEEAAQAIQLGPDQPFSHYVVAQVWRDRRHYPQALAAVREAIRLDPEDADYCALEGEVHLAMSNWGKALVVADRGLALDAEHVACINLRAMALNKLGRSAEATRTLDQALARDPDNATSHANRGWSMLEQNQPDKAAEHFRESLRLDPNNEWARQGMIEALKARHLVYSWMLRYFLWMSRFSAGAQWGIIVGGYVGNRLLSLVAQKNPEWAPYVLPLRILYVVFALLTWIANPLFNLLLRLSRFGRLILSDEEITATNWIGGSLLLAVMSLAGCLVFGWNGLLLISAAVFGFLLIPLAGTFNCQPGWPRKTMGLYTGILAAFGLACLGLFLASGYQRPEVGRGSIGLATTFFQLFFIGSILSGWVANFLMMQRPKR